MTLHFRCVHPRSFSRWRPLGQDDQTSGWVLPQNVAWPHACGETHAANKSWTKALFNQMYQTHSSNNNIRLIFCLLVSQIVKLPIHATSPQSYYLVILNCCKGGRVHQYLAWTLCYLVLYLFERHWDWDVNNRHLAMAAAIFSLYLFYILPPGSLAPLLSLSFVN